MGRKEEGAKGSLRYQDFQNDVWMMGLCYFLIISMATTHCNISKHTCAVLWLTLTHLFCLQPIVRLVVFIPIWQDNSHLESFLMWQLSKHILLFQDDHSSQVRSMRARKDPFHWTMSVYLWGKYPLPLAWFVVVRFQRFKVTQSLPNADNKKVETWLADRDSKSWRHHQSPKSVVPENWVLLIF